MVWQAVSYLLFLYVYFTHTLLPAWAFFNDHAAGYQLDLLLSKKMQGAEAPCKSYRLDSLL